MRRGGENFGSGFFDEAFTASGQRRGTREAVRRRDAGMVKRPHRRVRRLEETPSRLPGTPDSYILPKIDQTKDFDREARAR
jgi:hypothetical protein